MDVANLRELLTLLTEFGVAEYSTDEITLRLSPSTQSFVPASAPEPKPDAPDAETVRKSIHYSGRLP